ncbi:MAG: class I SAM-dependent methyltransferase [Saccharofermentans sp.]|nr:class I SAM-dependent methyltransferase [Saccharofermentans sp.]
MDPTIKFDGYAGDYTAGRPGYSTELIDSFYKDFGMTPDSVIADIGSGTGKFAAFLLKRGSDVFAVEPNSDMRRVAEEELSSYPKFHSVNGGAESTTLPDNSVDFITTAQAFHWFDVVKFRSECFRIIRPGGKVLLVWNVRDESDPVNSELKVIYKKYCPNFAGFNGGIVKDDPRIREFFFDKYEHVSFDHPLVLDREKFISRSLSGSYSLKEGDRDYDEYMASVLDVFDKYSKDGTVTIGNRSEAYIGCVN